jgi:uncharacterized membrane-anchored protein YhcB (DUF1043 family)
MEWLFEHWRAVIIGTIVLVVVGASIFGLSTLIPDSATVKSWSVQESIFYGFLVLAFATWMS